MAAPTKKKVGNTYKKGKPGKRHLQNTEDGKQNDQAKQDETFTATHFKFMLRDKETAATGFQKFIEATTNEDYDIVKEYVTSSLECTEIFEVMDRQTLKPNELALVFNCFEKILLHITEKEELEEYFSVGKRIVTKLLTDYMRNIMFALNMKSKSAHIKAALKLLTAMVMLSSLTASLVLNNMNFSESTITSLFERRDVQDKEDVRTCMLHLIIAFMLSEGSEVIRKLVDIKGFLEHAFHGMVYDRMALVQLFLNTVSEKVVRNAGISKTAKTQLFNSKVLNSLGNLFKWKGPVRRKEKLQKGSKDQQVETDGPDTGLTDRISEITCNFLLEICTSYAHGIIFKDMSMGTSERNNNQMLTNFLLTLTFTHQNTFARELVVKSLSACPQQIPFFLPNLSNKLEPQLTKTWIGYVDLVCKIYQSLPMEPPVLKTKEHRTVEQTVDILLLYTCPPPQFTSTFLTGFKKHSIVQNHLLLKIIHILTDRAVKILTLINNEDSTDSRTQKWLPKEKREIAALYKKAVIQSLPEPKVIYGCFETAQKNRSEEELTKLKDFTDGDWTEVDVRIVQTFCVYQELLPCILVDNHLVLTRLIDQIMQQYTSDNYLPQIYLLKLLAGTDARRLPWAKQNKKGHTLVYQLLEMVSQLAPLDSVRDTSLELLCKLLLKTGLFDGFAEELTAWIKPLQSQKGLWKDITCILNFMSSILTSYMSNPYPYMDKVSDLVSEAAFLKTGGLDKSSAMNNEEKFRAVVAMDIDNLDEDDNEDLQIMSPISTSTKRFPFCPVLLVALETFKKNQEKIEDIRNYLSLVIAGVFHLQVDPVTLCLQLQKCGPEDLLDGVQTYILTWLPNIDSPKKSQKKKRRKEANSNQVLTLQRYEEMVQSNTLFQLDQVDCVTFVRQQLLHLTYILGHLESHDSFLEEVSGITQNICAKVEENFSSSNKEMETSQVSQHPPILETSVREPAVLSSVKTVLTHPTVMENFFCENIEVQSSEMVARVESVLTDLVIQLLRIVTSNGMSVGSVLDYYHRKVLNSLKIISGLSYAQQQQQQILPSLYSYLKLMVQDLDIDRCVEVFHHMLSIQTSDGNTDMCSILNNLILKLTASPIRNIKMNETSISQMISCFLKANNVEEIGSVTEFFCRFPALTVLCPYQQFVSILNCKNFERLAVVLLQNNCQLRSQFEDSLNSEKDEISSQTHHLPVIVELLKIYSTKMSENNSSLPGVIYAVRKKLEPDILRIAGLDNCENAAHIFELFQLLLKMEAFDKSFVEKLEKKVCSSLEHKDTSVLQTYHVQMTDLILNSPLSESSSNVNYHLLRICFECLTNLLSKKKHSNFDVARELLNILFRIPKEDMQTFPGTWDAFKDVWPAFCFKALRYLYTDIKTLKVLTKSVSVVYADSADVGLPIGKLVAMVTSHTSFLPVMFNEEREEIKDALVDLLMELLQLSPESCEAAHVVIYLGAYGATLSLTDQKILKLLHIYEINGIDLYEFRPFLWGEKAIEHQMLTPNDKLKLIRMKMGKVLGSVDSEKMQETILNFPLTRRLQNHDVQEAEKYRGLAITYDPLFFLSQFSFLLGPDRYVECRKFMEYDCLGLVFACLSSHDRAIRSAAYHILEHFQLHLQEGRFLGQDDLQYLLRLLRNSLTEPVCKLAPLITVFLARATRLLFEPGNHMYTVIKSFLIAKPTLDIFDIPEFYKLFNSSSTEHKTERLWILTLMQEGLREIADFRIFEKRYSFKVLFSFYDTETADTESQIKVLQIVKSACKERAMAWNLCNEHGLLTWIATVISKLLPEKKRHVTEVVHIVHSFWSTMVSKIDTSKEKPGHLDSVFTSQILTLVQALLWFLRDIKKEVLHLYLKTLMSVVKHSNLISSPSKQDETNTVPSCLSYSDLLVILVLVQRIQGEDFLVKTALNILSFMGYSTEILENPSVQQPSRKGLLTSIEVNDEQIVESDEEKKEHSNEEQEEDQEQTEKAVVETVKENRDEEDISRNLLTLILSEKFTMVEVYQKELLAARVVFIEWVLNRLENRNDSDMLLDGLKFVCSLLSDNHCLLEVICLESETGDRIITALLNMYSVIYSEHVRQSIECVYTLNRILVKIVEKKFGRQISGPENEEEMSCVLRKVFASDGSTKLSTLTTPNQGKRSRHSRKRKAELEDAEVEPGKKHKEKALSRGVNGESNVVESLYLVGNDRDSSENKADDNEDKGEDDDDQKMDSVFDMKTPDRRKSKLKSAPVKTKKARTLKSTKKSLHTTRSGKQ